MVNKMNKKGVLIPVVTVFGMIILLYAAYSIYTDANQPATEVVGKLQTDIIQLQQLGEKRVFYVDQLAKYAGYNAIEELAQNKLFVDKCSTWDTGDCNPVTGFEEEFKKQFEKEFYELVDTAYFEHAIPKDYKFTVKIEKDRIILTGKTEKEIFLYRTGKYKVSNTVNPSFKQELDYTTEDYAKFVEVMLNAKLITCLRNSLNPNEDCKKLISAKNQRDFDWVLDKNANIATFMATSKTPKGFVGRVVYMFAIDLNKTPFYKKTAI